MKKIDLYLILAFKEQTEKLLQEVARITALEAAGRKEHVSNLIRHVYVLTKFFNLRNFFAEGGTLKDSRTPLIYHIPYGLENRETGVEEALETWRGKVPVVARSYDPHSPVKMSPDYLARYHDLVLTYNRILVDNDRFRFAYLTYDNHLVSVCDRVPSRKKLCCMILANKFTADGPKKDGYEIFGEEHFGIRNIYPERNRLAACSRLDVYGAGWDGSLPNYRGKLVPFDRKYTTASRYRFAVALENCENRTFISEKIHDCFLTLNVPVYLGAPDVADHLPPETFVDPRHFEDYESLFDALETMTEREYTSRIEAIRESRFEIFKRFSTVENVVLPIYDWYASTHGGVASPNPNEIQTMEEDLNRMRLVRNPGARTAEFLAPLRRLKHRFRPGA